jgi:hypothetical protein
MCSRTGWRIIPLFIFIIARPATAIAQYGPYRQWQNPPNGPRAQREFRERAVAFAGPESRAFVESCDEAARAIYFCTQIGAWRLVEFHNSGGLARLPRARDALRAIAQPGGGDDVVVFVVAHAEELKDIDCFDAFVSDPLTYAYGLKRLDAGTEEIRTRRIQIPLGLPLSVTWDGREVSSALGALGLTGLVVWWLRHRHR